MDVIRKYNMCFRNLIEKVDCGYRYNFLNNYIIIQKFLMLAVYENA